MDKSSKAGILLGMFDGIHLGHLALIHRLSELLGPHGEKALITFNNHPSEVLKKGPPVPFICTKEHKIRLLKQAGVETVFFLDFTPEFAEKTYDQFLKEVEEFFPFQYLVVGKGDAFGYRREGTEERVKELGKKLSFQADYIEKFKIDGETVSSSKIRELIRSGDIKKAAKFLGRPYSIYAPLQQDGSVDVLGLCLPPEAAYNVVLVKDKERLAAQAVISDGRLKIVLTYQTDRLIGRTLEIVFGE